MRYFESDHEFFDFPDLLDADKVGGGWGVPPPTVENILNVENILKSETYVYFTKLYQLKVESVKTVGKKYEKRVVLSSSVGSIERNFSTFTLTKRQWWSRATGKSSRKRSKIRDYNQLLNTMSGDEMRVLPDYCPVFGNLRLNYTGIDFEGGYNLRKCCKVAGYNNMGETWSPATIDRVDNEMGYEYGNIRIISHYANTLKRDSDIKQLQMVINYIRSHRRVFEIDTF